MEISSYNICLLITKDKGINFGITGLQTNNTLNVGIETFINKEEVKITETKFKGKSQKILKISALGDFNGYYMTIKTESIIIM